MKSHLTIVTVKLGGKKILFKSLGVIFFENGRNQGCLKIRFYCINYF